MKLMPFQSYIGFCELIAKVNFSISNLGDIIEYCEFSIEHLNPVLPVYSGGGVGLNPSLLKLFS